MKTIIETPGEPYMIEDRTTPVFESKNNQSRLWLSLHEAASVTGETIHAVVASADTGLPTKAGNQFGYPTRKVLRAYLPDYRFVCTVPRPPVPVLAVFEIKEGRRSHKEERAYRTLTAFRQCNDLSIRSTEIILSRDRGWRDVLGPKMLSATSQAAGWTPAGGWSKVHGARTTTPLFFLGVPRSGRGVTIKYRGPAQVDSIADLHHVILAHS